MFHRYYYRGKAPPRRPLDHRIGNYPVARVAHCPGIRREGGSRGGAIPPLPADPELRNPQGRREIILDPREEGWVEDL